MDIIIRNARVLTMDEDDTEYEQADILIDLLAVVANGVSVRGTCKQEDCYATHRSNFHDSKNVHALIPPF